MKIDRQKIEQLTREYLNDLSFEHEIADYVYEYTDTIADIAELAGYKFADLWDDNDGPSMLQNVIDVTLYNTSVEMGLYDELFD